jgi:hypothetical protein
VKDLVYETRRALLIFVKDLEAVLSKYYLEYMRTGAIAPTNKGAALKYSHLEMAKKFAGVLDKI